LSDQLKVYLPHNYGKDPVCSVDPTIALAIDNAVNCFKMLKALHRAPRLASEGEALYADCRVEIRELLVIKAGPGRTRQDQAGPGR